MSQSSIFLNELKKNIELHAALGINSYQDNADLRHFMASSPSKEDIVQNKFIGKPQIKKQTPKSTVTIEKQSDTKTLIEIKKELGDCTRCSLHKGRSRILFGYGNPKADLLIISEWPNMEDNAEGRLFSGADGELLGKMLAAINLSFDDVYLTALVKCKATEENPPDNTQLQTCRPFLLGQLDAVRPKVICTMGPLACRVILNTQTPLLRLRGAFHKHKSFTVMPTFHPSYLLKNPEMKKATWIDLQMIQREIGQGA